MKAIRRFIQWLGPQRTQIIFFLLAGTGLLSLLLNVVGQQYPTVRLVQSLLVIVFLVGSAITVITRFPVEDRRQLVYVLGPSLIAVSLGLLFPNLALFFLPIAVGWVLISMLTMRGRVRQEYQIAVKHMRKAEYKEAIHTMTELINAEPDQAVHYRFRAELSRLAGRLRDARDDYEKVIELTPESGIGYNGLAEVYLQEGRYDEAVPWGKQAVEHESDEWVAAYNMGMIQDRRRDSADTLRYLEQALKSGIADSRHRLLAQLWMARAYYRLQQPAEAKQAIKKMHKESVGLHEWETIFENAEAAVLKNVLAQDVHLAKQLIEQSPEAVDLALLA